MLPFTQKLVREWAGPAVFDGGMKAFERGAVTQASFEAPELCGQVESGGRTIRCRVRVDTAGHAENLCPCHDSRERGVICIHAVAVALAMIRRATDPHREEKLLEEKRKAARLAALDEAAFLRRTVSPQPNAALRLVLAREWQTMWRAEKVRIACELELNGKRYPIDAVPARKAVTLSEKDDALLYVLEDICEGPARAGMEVRPADFTNLLDLLKGQSLWVEDQSAPAQVHAAELTAHLRVDLDGETGELLIMPHCELPFLAPGEFPFYIVSRHGGWAFGAGNFWPLESVLPLPLQSIYQEPVVIPRDAVLRFLDQELVLLRQQTTIETDLDRDMFQVDPEMPRFDLQIKGSPASLSATLHAVYGDVRVPAGKPDPAGHFCHPDPADLLRYTVRHPAAEDAALCQLAERGFHGEDGDALTPIVGTREVQNFLAGELPALRRMGWQVELSGRVATHLDEAEFVMPVVHIREPGGSNWFEVDFDFEDGQGQSITPQDVWRAMRKGESFIERGGRTLLLDRRAIESMHKVFEDCSAGEGSRGGSFRLSSIYAAYVHASVDALDGVDVESSEDWRTRAESLNRTGSHPDVKLPEALAKALRGYQKEGVNWLRFLENHGLGGILADEMGLGKTLQTLAWLQGKRSLREAQGKPALIVCPTSLVENWAEEAERWVPSLKVLVLSGAERHERWSEVETTDLVVTSYALIRRDIDRYAGIHFSAAVLDEAQHIKNHSTQNSKAAKRLRAQNRLVLTGTPIENSVADLWSIMDFLMPGYLGPNDAFRQGYELPISRGGDEASAAQSRLRRKLQPFLLRRLKRDVAKELPPKIERIGWCTLTPDQRVVYDELLQASQRRLADLVSKQGFNKSRMEILTTLLRLRQLSCHLDLLKLPDLKAEEPSGKLNMFTELLDEALDGGHRLLVFSQFVSMLKILRAHLDGAGIDYCYLDGSTKNRMEEVRRFNGSRNIPAFLISLKAGGTGLNLTGADMVIHFDPWWNPAVEDQATDRAYRIGQKRTVYSVKLIARGTVEEKVLALQRKKRAVIDATLGSDEQVMEKMEWDDVREILDMK